MGDMEKRTATLDRAGRIVIPATVRKELKLGEGDELIVRVKDGMIEMYTLAEAIRRAQEFCRPYFNPDKSVVDELLEDRQRDLEAELGT
jgi:AbrB family looped-hinge helix DNA binding protein